MTDKTPEEREREKEGERLRHTLRLLDQRNSAIAAIKEMQDPNSRAMEEWQE